LPGYVLAQFVGAVLGVLTAHVMFDLPLLQSSVHARAGMAQMFSEFVAAAGLLGTILLVSRQQPARTAAAVACYIAAGYWFTASTSFANPAVSVARTLTNTFAGIRPEDAPGFVIAQILATLLCAVLARCQRNPAII
jgi:glycerol uptake facilitator-like aquaporin